MANQISHYCSKIMQDII